MMIRPHICRGPTGQARGEKICHVEKFHISVHFLHIGFNFKFLYMTDVEKSEVSFVVCTIHGILLHFTLFCWKICCFFVDLRCFVAKSVFAIYTLLCEEKFSQK